ncbi:hypothetical protein EST38_g3914 [Candolleomyces aberdarensis]|uniref:PABS domain-containing protein n=1 Tax=Candolleomyces aberdarensis TaxID=2316362 RepID=A0A4Q2DPG0_9AGAR|nr:hypothetical protein EST38_g3914 [Candolleomyces aberdarensis]
MSQDEGPKPLVLLANNAYVIGVLSPLSLVIYAYERALVPLYGSGPTTEHLNKFVILGALLAAVNPVHLQPWINWLLIALALTVAPNANYWVPVWTSREHNAILGTLKTHAAVLLPLVFIMSSPVMRALDKASSQTGLPIQRNSASAPLVYRASRTIIIFFVANGLARDFWSTLSFLRSVSESQIYLGIAAIYFILFVFTVPAFSFSKPKKAPKKLGPKRKDTPPVKQPEPEFTFKSRTAAAVAFAGIWAVSYRIFSNPVLPHPLKNTFIHPTHPVQVYSSVQSVTGLISVAEWLPPKQQGGPEDELMHSARYLRASHSILGGVWTHDKVAVLPGEEPLKDSFGTPLGDSIYSAFTLQEAVRFVNSTAKGKKGRWQNALVIGLGTGTSTTALIRHGIDTTIIEIDPAVYEAARTYFGLPDPGEGKVHLEDAREWVGRRRQAIESGDNLPLFDIVIHDCFSGGGVPQDLFTKQFWSNLKKILDPEAVVVINFAGIVKSEATMLVVNTLLDSFGQCRGFHDVFGDLPKEKYDTEFINIASTLIRSVPCTSNIIIQIFFCTPSSTPLTFRKSRTSDYLGSYLRRHVLSSLDTREVDLSIVRDHAGGHILTDTNNPLGPLQEKQGGHHWEVMREVLPDYHWETY